MQENTTDERDITVLSFGAGVQSTTLLMLVINKDPRLIKAIGGEEHLPTEVMFADPGAETDETYAHVERMSALCEQSGLNFWTVNNGSLTDAIIAGRGHIPAFIKKTNGGEGVLFRSCTEKFKIRPIYKKLRAIMGYEPRTRIKHTANVWLGISLDEVQRMKDNHKKWATNIYPLIEMRWDRLNCINYLESLGSMHVGKSACVYCPYHSNRFWLDIKLNDPKSWSEACRIDDYLRADGSVNDKLDGVAYLHRSCKPLSEADLGENQLNLFDMFGNECEGMCGL